MGMGSGTTGDPAIATQKRLVETHRTPAEGASSTRFSPSAVHSPLPLTAAWTGFEPSPGYAHS